MNTETPLSLLEKKIQSRFVLALIFFVLIAMLAGGLFLYNRSLESQIHALESEIQEVRSAIREREGDPLIAAYSLYTAQAGIFETLAYQSMIPDFVTHLKNTGLRYNIAFDGFDYSEGILRTNATSSNDDSRLGYQKVVQFLQNYRADEDALFELASITQFSGHDRIEYTIEMQLKNTHELRTILQLDGDDRDEDESTSSQDTLDTSDSTSSDETESVE